MEIDFVVNNKKMKAVFPVNIKKDIVEWKNMLFSFDPSIKIVDERLINV
jgi:hypothetical protein